MSEPAMDLESVAGPSNPKTPPRAASPTPYIPSTPFKSSAWGLNPTSNPFAPSPSLQPIPDTSYKRKRSNTLPGLPTVREEIVAQNPNCNYWEQRMAQRISDAGTDPSQVDFGFFPIILDFLTEIQADYTKRLSFLEDLLELEENSHSTTKMTLNNLDGKFKTITSNRQYQQMEPLLCPLPLLTKRQRKGLDSIIRTGPLGPLPKSTSASAPEPAPIPPPPPPPPPPTAPTPAPAAPQGSWAQVAGKKKKKTPTTIKPAPAAPPTTNTKPPQTKKGLSLRERKLIIKRDGSKLSSSTTSIRDSINTALNSTTVQRVEVDILNNITLITMDTVKATSLNTKAAQFLHLIPGTTTVQLDSPSAHLLVHGIPTSSSLADIGKELTTYNTGLALAEQPRWLTTDDKRTGKSASTVTIIATGPKAQDFASKSRLCAFSKTFRVERRLRFNLFTQCANCQQFGHHTLRCTNAPACRWCAKPHSSREHTCSTSTCSAKGRACPHTIMACVTCAGPHDSHSPSCAKRPSKAADTEMATT
jgi:hypothetical protein